MNQTLGGQLVRALRAQAGILLLINVLATQTRQPPTRDSARASYENQNQNIKILLYYITTMSSTTPQLLSLGQENRMQIVL
jgi:hypothetical protein